jgi:enediyne biosynthesis protein E4
MALFGNVSSQRSSQPTVSMRASILLLAALAGCGSPSATNPVTAESGRTTPNGSSTDTNRELRITAPAPAHERDLRWQFPNVAATSGIDFTYYNDEVPGRFFLPEIMGGGAAWADFDNDGRWDVYFTNGCPAKEAPADGSPYHGRLYRNLGRGQFTDVLDNAQPNPAIRFGQGCAAGDFNADGFVDLYLSNYGPNVLLMNNGDGTFSDISVEAGVDDALWSSSALWHDLDDDGQLDLLSINYLDVTFANLQSCRFNGKPGYCGPGDYQPQPDRAYLNQGDGSFVDAAAALGLLAAAGKGLAVTALDLDGDLQAEIYVANDMMPNFLYTRSRPAYLPQEQNTGDAPYREVAGLAGCAVSDIGLNEASMGIACGDFDRDGLTDIFLSHFYQQKNTLYRNLGKLLFKDDSRRSRIAATSFEFLGFGTVTSDFDRDGALDLFIANGHVLGPLVEPNVMRPQLLHNDGQGRFNDFSELAGPYFHDLWLGRGVSSSDYDNDGDLDLVVTHLHRPVALLRNDTPATGHFLGLDLRTAERVPPVGGHVVVKAGEQQWNVPIAAGGSYLATHDARLLFAVPGDVAHVDLEIHWPTGQVDLRPQIAVDRYWRVYAEREPEPWPANGW